MPDTFNTILQASGKYPDYLEMQPVPLKLEAAGKDGEGRKIPSFSMTAYTGGIMYVAGFDAPVVVDLEGLDIRQDVPIRLDHNPGKGVGHTTSVTVRDYQLFAEGVISRENSWARDVVKSGLSGFPWQASIGAGIFEAEFVAAGTVASVNNRTFEGPIYVVRKAVLKEISFVDNGADSNTVATIAAKENTKMNFSKWLKANGFTESDLNETQLKSLKAAYQATLVANNGGDAPEKPADDDNNDEGGDVPEANEGDRNTGTDADQSGSDIEAASVTASLQATRNAQAADTKRIARIREICASGHSDIEAEAIRDGWTTDKVELHVLRASRAAAPAIHTSHGLPASGRERILEAAAIMSVGQMTSKLEASYGEQVLDAANKIRGLGIQELFCMASQQQLPNFKREPRQWLQAAFSTVSLSGILSNIANKMLLQGYNSVDDAWRKIVKTASVNDFKEHTRYRMDGNFKFQPVGPDGELKHGGVSEQNFTNQVSTSGIMFSLTREMIVNDDLGAFADIPFQIGLGAGEAISDAVWELLLVNPIQTDGKTFFSVEHKNYLTGAETALCIDALTAAEVAFSEQTKPNGRPLGVPAKILLVPPALKVIAEQLMTALMVNETTTANKPKPANNPHAGKFEVASSSWLSNSLMSGSSSKAWYLFADPNRLPALEVAFLNGNQAPTVENADADFNVLGVQFRAYIDFGVKEQDYRGALKVKGEN